jgi:hypothetical protein
MAASSFLNHGLGSSCACINAESRLPARNVLDYMQAGHRIGGEFQSGPAVDVSDHHSMRPWGRRPAPQPRPPRRAILNGAASAIPSDPSYRPRE